MSRGRALPELGDEKEEEATTVWEGIRAIGAAKGEKRRSEREKGAVGSEQQRRRQEKGGNGEKSPSPSNLTEPNAAVVNDGI